jgi:hypothetical protein
MRRVLSAKPQTSMAASLSSSSIRTQWVKAFTIAFNR